MISCSKTFRVSVVPYRELLLRRPPQRENVVPTKQLPAEYSPPDQGWPQPLSASLPHHEADADRRRAHAWLHLCLESKGIHRSADLSSLPLFPEFPDIFSPSTDLSQTPSEDSFFDGALSEGDIRLVQTMDTDASSGGGPVGAAPSREVSYAQLDTTTQREVLTNLLVKSAINHAIKKHEKIQDPLAPHKEQEPPGMIDMIIAVKVRRRRSQKKGETTCIQGRATNRIFAKSFRRFCYILSKIIFALLYCILLCSDSKCMNLEKWTYIVWGPFITLLCMRQNGT